MVSKPCKHFPYYPWFLCFLVNSDEISINLIGEVEVSNEEDEEIMVPRDINTSSTSGITPTSNKKKENRTSSPRLFQKGEVIF